MQSGTSIAVFDFDHTITDRDTAAGFFGWLLHQHALRLVLGAPVVLLLSPFAAFRRTRKIPVRFAVWLATFGHNHEQLQKLAIEYIARVVGRGARFVREDARAQIKLHQSQGHTVVVATGALECLAREILADAGIGDIIVVGSSLRSFLGGMVADQHCFGIRKLGMLQERGFSPPWACVYSDHESDLPLLRAGTQQFLVNPTARTAAHLLPVLGSSVTVVTWR